MVQYVIKAYKDVSGITWKNMSQELCQFISDKYPSKFDFSDSIDVENIKNAANKGIIGKCDTLEMRYALESVIEEYAGKESYEKEQFLSIFLTRVNDLIKEDDSTAYEITREELNLFDTDDIFDFIQKLFVVGNNNKTSRLKKAAINDTSDVPVLRETTAQKNANTQANSVGITNATKAFFNSAHKDYVDRDGLNEVFKKWRQDKDHKLFWIHGDVGTGKTAFMAHICSQDKIPVYFCKKGDIRTADPKELTLFLIRVLCQTLPTYNELFHSKGVSSDDLKQQDADSLFLNYIAEGLDNTASETAIIIGIDGLDEVFQNGEINLLNWLTRRLADLPEWICFVFTSRNDPYIRRKLGRYKHVDISQVCSENDISKYLADRLTSSNPTELQIEKLTEICKGNFLYATLIANEISDGRRRIEDIGNKAFPDGLGEIFSDCLEWRLTDFEENFYAEHIRPVLEVVCAAHSPMRLESITHILNTNIYEMTDVLGVIRDLFSVKDGNKIVPIHISVIEWLCDASYSGALYNRFFVDVKNGHANISKYYNSIRQQNCGGDKNIEYYQFLCTHLLAAENLGEAKSVLCDLDFQKECISLLGVNTAIRQYVSDLYNLSGRAPSLADQVMEGAAFADIVGEYRDFFYNSGLYFDLAACGLDNILNKEPMNWSLGFHISICNYLYIVKTFQDALIHLQMLQEKYQDKPGISVAEKAEFLNMLALCQQKATDYASAERNYKTVLDLAQLPKVNEAFALINMGKISCYKQEKNWKEKAQKYFARAVESIVANHSMESCTELEKKNRFLLEAEYLRIDAYYSIWAGNQERARDKLQHAKSIYDDLSAYGMASRYYTRYLYTWAMYNLSVHNTEEAEQMCNKSLEQITDAKDYDYCQIHFIQALIAFSNHNVQNCRSLLVKAKKRAQKIMGWVELEEIDTLEQYVLGFEKKRLTDDTPQSLAGKVYIEKWTKNVWTIYAHMLSNDGWKGMK